MAGARCEILDTGYSMLRNPIFGISRIPRHRPDKLAPATRWSGQTEARWRSAGNPEVQYPVSSIERMQYRVMSLRARPPGFVTQWE